MRTIPDDAQREGFTQDFVCTTDSSNPASSIRWFVEGEDRTYLSEANQQDGDYSGQYVTSQLSLLLSRNNAGQNVTCIPSFEGDTHDVLMRNVLTNTTCK